VIWNLNGPRVRNALKIKWNKRIRMVWSMYAVEVWSSGGVG